MNSESKGALTLVSEAIRGWLRHDAQMQGAALAFFTVFAMAPLLMLVVAVAALIL